MRFVAIWLCLAGCGFSSRVFGGDDTSVDAATDSAIDTVAIDTAPDTPTNLCLTGAWCRRKPIAISGAMVSGGPHDDFPLFVSLASDPDLAADARADGFDIRFTAADGTTPLAHQRTRFDSATGRLEAWVNLPSLDSSTTLFIYYGNAAAADQQNVAAAWSGAYAGVWHFDETTGGAAAIRDATTNNNHGTTNGASPGSAGRIGNAVSFDGTNDYLQIADSGSLDATADAATFSMWVRFVDPSAGRYQYLLVSSNAFSNPSDGNGWSVQPDGDHYIYPWVGNMNAYNLATNPFANQTWHHIAATYNWTTKEARLYRDGQQLAITMNNVMTMWTQLAQPASWHLGGTPTSAGWFGGLMDEVRVANVVRSPQWLQTEFRNQNSPSTFYTVGPEQVLD